MAIIGEEPVLSKLDRLDNVVHPFRDATLRQSGNLQEMRGCNRPSRSSCASSTPSSGTLTSTEGHPSSIGSSPRSLEKRCRPIDHVMAEIQVKGTLIERLDQVEDRLLKLCMQLEEELVAEKKREENVDIEKKARKKGNKQLVKQCVQGKALPTQSKGQGSKLDGCSVLICFIFTWIILGRVSTSPLLFLHASYMGL
ncbi:uncharacterized protein LOC111304493 isoform X2 [Durio zibethinus]|uniref:Uncharacterized protein LOC111304493 isoform X2 n=1 Tax=Durio zibethinus TaxID=66656 RepID=A0A6P5ZVL0_DURZI|nr:uncharacterized protein LOC111304493 isoform X2 [Durio zibethinus]